MFLYSTVSTLKPVEFEREKRAFHLCAWDKRQTLGRVFVAKLTDGRDGGDDFAQLKLIEDGGFAGCVQSD